MNGGIRGGRVSGGAVLGGLSVWECVPITPYSILDLEACTALYILKLRVQLFCVPLSLNGNILNLSRQ